MRPLTDKQRRFVEEYLLDLNASAAYQRAGYKAKGNAAEVNAARLLRNAQVKQAVAAAQAARSHRTEIKADDVLRELGLVAYQRANQLYRPDGTLKAPDEWDEGVSATIAGVEVFEEFEGTGGNRTLVGHTKKVKRWDKVRALELLGKHLGLFIDRTEVTFPGSVPISPTDAEEGRKRVEQLRRERTGAAG